MGTPPTIGVLSPFVSGFYFGAIIRGIAAAAAEAGVRLVAIQTSDPGIVYYDRPVNLPHPHAAGWEHLDGCIVVIDAATPSVPGGDPAERQADRDDQPAVRRA